VTDPDAIEAETENGIASSVVPLAFVVKSGYTPELDAFCFMQASLSYCLGVAF
jgi:hypothetical protein